MARKLQALLLVLICLTGGTKVHATNPDTYLLFSISKANKARLGIVNSTKKNLKLEILNSDDILLFEKTVSGYENFFQMLDLSTMPDGDYTVRLMQGTDEAEIKKFTVSNGTAELLLEKKEVAPVFRLVDDGSLIVSYLNAKENPVNIFFEYNGEVVFEERDIRDMPVSKRYSLARLPRGNYIVKLYSGGRIYDFNMTLN